jgi:DNA-binding PucR family transcriptional regulator
VSNEDHRIAEVVRQILPHRDAITALVVDDIVREIPEFAHDARLMALLEAAATENVSAAMHAIALGTRLDTIDAPQAGLEHARILAQREVPITVLLRAYRLGQTRFVEGVLEQAREMSLDPGASTLDLVRAVSTYIDRISDQVAHAYEQERELWVGSKAALRQHWVSQLLSAAQHLDVSQAERALRYRLDGWHVAVEAWTDETHDHTSVVGYFDRAAGLIRRAGNIRTDHLSVPTDAFQGRLWFPVSESWNCDPAGLTDALVAAGNPVRLAIGDRRQGVAGFRGTAATAKRVKSLALSARCETRAVLSHADVAPVALLMDDPVELHAFVTATLGALAAPDPRSEDLRETLLAYLEANRSYHLAASRLHVHRNTVHYRVQQAMEQVDAELGSDTFALQMALTICRWLPL